jgi:branched-chain amino acid transport system substrate-binding protein
MTRSAFSSAVRAALLVAGALALAVLAACGSKDGGSGESSGGSSSGDKAAATETYQIGFGAGKTGFLSFYDGPVELGMKAAIEDVNERGLAGKFKIELTVKDTKSEPARAATVVQELLSGGSKFIVSPCDVDAGLPGSIIAVRQKVPVMSSCAGDSTYRARAGDRAFLNVPGTLAEGAVSAEWAYEQGHRKAYVVTSHDIGFTQTMSEAFEDRFKELGGEILGTNVTSLGDTNYRAAATKIVSAKPDVIYTTMILPGLVSLMKDLERAGNKSVLLVNDAADADATLEGGPQLDNTTMVSLGTYTGDGAVAEQFIAKYEQQNGSPPPDDSAISGGDAIYEIAAALKLAGSSDPEKVFEALNNLKDAVTVSGLTTYQGNDGVPVKPFTIYTFDREKKTKVAGESRYAEKIPELRK